MTNNNVEERYAEYFTKLDHCVDVTRKSVNMRALFPGEIERSLEDLSKLKLSLESIRAYSASAIQVGVLGHTDSGKSSLINALCGKKLATVKRAEGQSFPVAYKWHQEKEDKQSVVEMNGSKVDVNKEEWANIESGENTKDFLQLEMSMCDQDWLRGIVIWDTPGLEGTEERGDKTMVYLPIFDVVVWVIMADKFRHAAMWEEYKKVSRVSERPLILVVNCQSPMSEQEYGRIETEVRKVAGVDPKIPIIIVKYGEIKIPDPNAPNVRCIRDALLATSRGINKDRITQEKLRHWKRSVHAIGEQLNALGNSRCGAQESILLQLEDMPVKVMERIKQRAGDVLEKRVDDEVRRIKDSCGQGTIIHEDLGKRFEKFTNETSEVLSTDSRAMLRVEMAIELDAMDWEIKNCVTTSEDYKIMNVDLGPQKSASGISKKEFLGGIAATGGAMATDFMLDQALDYILGDIVFGFGIATIGRVIWNEHQKDKKKKEVRDLYIQALEKWRKSVMGEIAEGKWAMSVKAGIDSKLDVYRKALKEKQGILDLAGLKREIEGIGNKFSDVLLLESASCDSKTPQDLMFKTIVCKSSVYDELIKAEISGAKENVIVQANYMDDWSDYIKLIDAAREKRDFVLEIRKLYVGDPRNQEMKAKHEQIVQNLAMNLSKYETSCIVKLYSGYRRDGNTEEERGGGLFRMRKIFVDKTRLWAIDNDPRSVRANARVCRVTDIPLLPDPGTREEWQQHLSEVVNIDKWLKYPLKVVYKSGDILKQVRELEPSPYLMKYGYA